MNLDNLFSNFDNEHSYAILFITIIGFLFGFFIGLLLKGAKARGYRKELKRQTEKLQTLETEKITLEGNLKKKDIEISNHQAETRDLLAKIENLEREKHVALADVENSNETIERLQASINSYTLTIEDLNNQIIALNTKNEHLLEEVNAMPLNTETPSENDASIRLQEETMDRLEMVESQLEQMAGQNQELRAILSKMESNQPLAASGFATREEEPDLEQKAHTGKDILGGKIIAKPNHIDDLTKIDGLGSFIEKKLNEIGIFTYEQISEWSEDMIEQVTEEIAFLPGRIEKDNWVAQATALLHSKKHDGGKKLPKKYRDDTNLKVIEGIGPKIEELFKDAGINNWTELSASSKKRLNEILEKAGKRYQMHDPTTWSKQATLAANGKWDELEKYQDELKGGRS